MSETIGDQSADDSGFGSDLIHAVILNLPKRFSRTMELKLPQPFKKSVSQSQTANSGRVPLYTAEDLMAVAAGVVRQVKVDGPAHVAEVHRSPITSPHSVIT